MKLSSMKKALFRKLLGTVGALLCFMIVTPASAAPPTDIPPSEHVSAVNIGYVAAHLDETPPQIIIVGDNYGDNPTVWMMGRQLEIIDLSTRFIWAELPPVIYNSPGMRKVQVEGSSPQTIAATAWVSIDFRMPLGAIVAWHKNFPVFPPINLPAGWVECNGQVLNDPASPYNGQTIPNLNFGGNFDGRFLRGGSTSGIIQNSSLLKHSHRLTGSTSTESAPHDHSVTMQSTHVTVESGGSHSHAIDGVSAIGFINGIDISAIGVGRTAYTEDGGEHSHWAGEHVHAATVATGEGSHAHDVDEFTTSSGIDETRPPNMSVVWIMRVRP